MMWLEFIAGFVVVFIVTLIGLLIVCILAEGLFGLSNKALHQARMFSVSTFDKWVLYLFATTLGLIGAAMVAGFVGAIFWALWSAIANLLK